MPEGCSCTVMSVAPTPRMNVPTMICTTAAPAVETTPFSYAGVVQTPRSRMCGSAMSALGLKRPRNT